MKGPIDVVYESKGMPLPCCHHTHPVRIVREQFGHYFDYIVQMFENEEWENIGSNDTRAHVFKIVLMAMIESQRQPYVDARSN